MWPRVAGCLVGARAVGYAEGGVSVTNIDDVYAGPQSIGSAICLIFSFRLPVEIADGDAQQPHRCQRREEDHPIKRVSSTNGPICTAPSGAIRPTAAEFGCVP
jgi:hypothetical protein